MSPVGVNVEIVKHRENGLLCKTEDEWFESLSELIESQPLRKKLGTAGRQTVVNRYSISAWKAPLIQLIFDAANSKK